MRWLVNGRARVKAGPLLISSIMGLSQGAASPGITLHVSSASKPPGILENHSYGVLPTEMRIQLILANAWAAYSLKAPLVTVNQRLLNSWQIKESSDALTT